MSSLRHTAPRRADRRNTILGAMILIAGSAAILWLALRVGTTKDLEVYLLAGKRFIDGASLYGNHFGKSLADPLPYTYPPLWAAAFSLVAWLPTSWVTIGWTLLDLALLLWVVRISYARFLDRLGDRRPVAIACLVAIMGLTAPVLSVFDLGQVGILLMALAMADVLPARTRLPRGVLVAAATAIKLVPGLFIVYWAVTRRWRAFTVAVASVIVLWLVAAILRPDASRVYWLHIAMRPERAGDAATVVDQSMRGLLERVGWSGPAAWALFAGLAIVVSLSRARRAHLAGDELAALSLVALGTLLASPLSWIHHAVWIVPATGVLLGDGSDRRRRIAWAVTVGLFVMQVTMWTRLGVPLPGPLAFLLGNAFVITYWVLLVGLPISSSHVAASEHDPDRDHVMSTAG